MNTRIKNLDLEKILFFDIETVPQNKDLDTNTEEFDLFRYKNRDKKTYDLPTEADTIELYNTTAALSPVYGKVVCISMGYVRNGNIYVKSLTGNEREILLAFFKALGSFDMTSGYNILRYDLPFLRIRAYINNVGYALPDKFSDTDQKPWDLTDRHIDTMDIIKGSGYNTFSLAEACYMFGIKSPKDDISGSDVAKVFYSEGVDRIAVYCNKDVIASVQLLCKLMGVNAPGTIIERSGDQKEDVLTRILKTRSLSTEIKTELLSKSSAMKLKKDRESLVKLVKTYLMKKDFTDEENEFFKELLKK